MDTGTVEFVFNTALSPATDASGKETPQIEEELRNRAEAIRLFLLWATDGITDVHVSRYGMIVYYVPQVLSREEVIEDVHSTVRHFADTKKFFPSRNNRGKKEPTAFVVDVRVPRPTHLRELTVTFNSDLYALPANAAEAARREEEIITNVLTGFDGCRKASVEADKIVFTLDTTRHTSVNEVQMKVESLLTDLSSSTDYFPFLSLNKDEREWEPKFTWEVTTIMA